MTTKPLSFAVYGIAQPAGSKRAFKHRSTGRVLVVDDAKKSRPWKQEVSEAALYARHGDELLEGPLLLEVTFWLPRPKGHFGKKGLRPSAPRFPVVRPDATKLLRAVEDACTGIIWRDDAQIVTQIIQKAYGDPPRCEIRVCPITLATVEPQHAERRVVA